MAHTWCIAADSGTAGLAEKLTPIVNEAYVFGEGEMFKDNLPRTNVDEVKKLIDDRKMLVSSSAAGDLEGCIYVSVSGTSAEVGMFAVAAAHRGTGVGTFLMAAAEQHARSQGCSALTLKLLRWDDYSHKMKQRLEKWYRKLGFEPTGQIQQPQDFMPPFVVAALMRPSVFIPMRKPIGK